MQHRTAFVNPPGLGVDEIGQRPPRKRGVASSNGLQASIRLLDVVRLGSSSVPSAVTFTAVLEAAMLNLTRYSVGSAERISIGPLKAEKPFALDLELVEAEGQIAGRKQASIVGHEATVELQRRHWTRNRGLHSQSMGVSTFKRSSPAIALCISGRASKTKPR